VRVQLVMKLDILRCGSNPLLGNKLLQTQRYKSAVSVGPESRQVEPGFSSQGAPKPPSRCQLGWGSHLELRALSQAY
jgi:hypothetical protein